MRKFITCAVVVVAFAAMRGNETLAAPIPKAPVPPSIDGKYTLLSSSGRVTTAKGGKGGFAPADTGGFGSRTTTTRSATTITKTTITIEPRTSTALPTIMEYTIDPTKSPMTIDVQTVSARGKKTKAVGIVEIIDNRLIIALAREGTERPKTTEEAEGVTVYYFLKAPPPPKTEYRIVAMTVGKEAEAEKELNKLAEMGFELVNTTHPAAANEKAAPTTVHFILKRTVKQP
jgi:uncharacterized protein (TIGR03067 family)